MVNIVSICPTRLYVRKINQEFFVINLILGVCDYQLNEPKIEMVIPTLRIPFGHQVVIAYLNQLFEI